MSKILASTLSSLLINSIFTMQIYAGSEKYETKQLNVKINKLKLAINHIHDKSNLFNYELAHVERQISLGINKLANTQKLGKIKREEVKSLQERLDVLQQKIVLQREELAKYLRARYVDFKQQQLKFFLYQDNIGTASRHSMYFDYILKYYQNLIDKISLAQKEIGVNQARLAIDIAQQEQFNHKFSEEQQKLEQHKQHGVRIIKSLNKNIRNKQQELKECMLNKKNSSILIKTLGAQALTTTDSMVHKKFALPVTLSVGEVQSLNHGVVFFANEGSAVRAVAYGEIVFSDWLKGYGLLLIIDHGNGLMTLYAHNQVLFKQKGAMVAQGEKIAAVGHSGGLERNGLYFEIRMHGKAVAPMQLLSS